MPVARATVSRARSISRSTSRAVAPPWFTMKFACTVEISAAPSRAPLSPAASISRPAKSPGGFRNTDPQLGTSVGCAACRRASSRSISACTASRSEGVTASVAATSTAPSGRPSSAR